MNSDRDVKLSILAIGQNQAFNVAEHNKEKQKKAEGIKAKTQEIQEIEILDAK